MSGTFSSKIVEAMATVSAMPLVRPGSFDAFVSSSIICCPVRDLACWITCLVRCSTKLAYSALAEHGPADNV